MKEVYNLEVQDQVKDTEEDVEDVVIHPQYLLLKDRMEELLPTLLAMLDLVVEEQVEQVAALLVDIHQQVDLVELELQQKLQIHLWHTLVVEVVEDF
jgi:hypothetical protein